MSAPNISAAGAERGFSNADRYGADERTGRVEGIHGNAEALAFAAEAIFHGDEAVLEDQFRRIRRADTHLVFFLADRKARRALADDKGRQAADAAGLARIGKDDEYFSQGAVRNKTFRAV